MEFTWVEIALVKAKSNDYPYFIYQIDQCKKINSLGDLGNETTTHMGATHAIPKFHPKISKSNSQEIGHKLLYPQIWLDLLNLFRYSDITNSPV